MMGGNKSKMADSLRGLSLKKKWKWSENIQTICSASTKAHMNKSGKVEMECTLTILPI